jgi:hypothetical protein
LPSFSRLDIEKPGLRLDKGASCGVDLFLGQGNTDEGRKIGSRLESGFIALIAARRLGPGPRFVSNIALRRRQTRRLQRTLLPVSARLLRVVFRLRLKDVPET